MREPVQGKFRFVLSGQDFQFEPRDKYRYPTHDDARAGGVLFSGVSGSAWNVLDNGWGFWRSFGVLKFFQQMYRSYQVWLLVDRVRYQIREVIGWV